ncbi:MAG: TetR/AcrR family transcriptional regulator [Pseudanabaenaceae cyanobacterium]|jgi:TetR/AcrR family transcriptional repressor of lmrAB and yxaGH operons
MSKKQIVMHLMALFRQQGYEGTSLTDIATATGLGRASLYHYFRGGKPEMATIALEQFQRTLSKEVIDCLRQKIPPREKLQLMFAGVARLFDQGNQPCLCTAFALDPQTSNLLQGRIQDILAQWLQAITTVLEEAGVPQAQAYQKAEDIVIRIQGALVLARELGDQDLFERTLQRLGNELLPDPPQK